VAVSTPAAASVATAAAPTADVTDDAPVAAPSAAAALPDAERETVPPVAEPEAVPPFASDLTLDVESAATADEATPAAADQDLAASSQSDVAGPGMTDGSSIVSGRADDLRRIAGIGPKIVLALNAAGIRTFSELAATDETALRAILRSAGLRLSPTLATWPQQARNLLDRDAEAAPASATPLGVDAASLYS
jgi:predicted flap endonuclease-1-like 5' DNA nuclease